MSNASGINTLYIDTTGTVFSYSALIHKAIFNVDNGATGTLTIRDNGSGGTIVLVLRNDNDVSLDIDFPEPIQCGTNIHATISGTGATAILLISDNMLR